MQSSSNNLQRYLKKSVSISPINVILVFGLIIIVIVCELLNVNSIRHHIDLYFDSESTLNCLTNHNVHCHSLLVQIYRSKPTLISFNYSFHEIEIMFSNYFFNDGNVINYLPSHGIKEILRKTTNQM